MSHVPHTLETSGYVYDMWKSDEPFGQARGFNIPAAESKDPAMILGNGVAMPQHNAPGMDRPGNLLGTADRKVEHRTQSSKQQEVNYLYLGLFAAVLAVALY
jgi:hypothetical protein